jgi:hypothetical protein
MSLGLIIGLLVVTALGGFVLFSFRLRDKPAPKALIAVHGLLAATSLVLLIVYASQH